MRPFFSFWVPKGSPFSLIQAHKRFKCQSCHYLMSATLLLVIRYPCNESRASLSLKMSFMHKFAATYCDNFFHLLFTKLVCFDQLSKIALGSPFLLAKVPIRSPFHSKLSPHFDKFMSSLHMGEVQTAQTDQADQMDQTDQTDQKDQTVHAVKSYH